MVNTNVIKLMQTLNIAKSKNAVASLITKQDEHLIPQQILWISM